MNQLRIACVDSSHPRSHSWSDGLNARLAGVAKSLPISTCWQCTAHCRGKPLSGRNRMLMVA